MVNLTRYNISIVLLVCLGSYTYGFSFAVFGTSIGEPGFYVYFALDREYPFYLSRKCLYSSNRYLAAKSSHTASILGAIAALFCAGAAIGTVIQGYTGDWLGRRKALAIAGSISLLGTAVVAGSVNLPMLFVFRFISGLGRWSSSIYLIARHAFDLLATHAPFLEALSAFLNMKTHRCRSIDGARPSVHC